MKTISAALKTHLSNECTTVATCLKITRSDGKEFNFTDHDSNITFNGDTYTASTGYSRTAMENTDSYNVDNIDLKGFFASNALVEDEFRAGFFDSAEMLIFLVNYKDLTQGRMILKKGFLGNIDFDEKGNFIVEIRGLKQSMAQLFGARYQPECRAALGDAKCNFPISPDYITRDKAYSVGDWVTVQLNNLAATDYAVPITNPDFESTLSTGWTTTNGSFSRSSTPYSGIYCLDSTGTDQFNQIYQDVDLTTEPSFSTTSADNGYLALYGTFMQRSNTANKLKSGLRLRILALDTNKSSLKGLYKGDYSRIDDNYTTWTFKNVGHALLPSGTRYLRIFIEEINHTGSATRELVDDILLRIIDLGGTTGLQELFGNRIFECTTAGTTASVTPSYSSTIDANNSDGTAIFTTRQSFTIDAVVNTVTDDKTFTLTLTDSRAVDDWFNYGVLTFEDGNNAGLSMEIKDWDRTGGDEVTLFLEMPYTVSSGDKCKLFAGCDKKKATCVSKFAIANSLDYPSTRGNVYNFRGEPFISGREFFAFGATSTTTNTYQRGKK